MKQPKNKLAGPDGALPVAPMSLSGVVRTSRGYAVATAVVALDGSVTVALQNSQSHKEYVAAQHKRVLLAATQRA